MRRLLVWACGVLVPIAAVVSVHAGGQTATGSGSSDRARQLHARAIVVDTHDDTTQRLLEKDFDIGQRHENGQIDVPRMREGGLDALFFSIWIPGNVTGATAVARAMRQIEAVRDAVKRHPADLVLATTAADVRRAAASGRIAALMGMEGGHMIDDDLGLLRRYAALGVRYLTLTHSQNTKWADSSGDTPSHNGLTPFGKDVVRELNRLGVMVDVSHVSDRTFSDALEVSRAPVIASHSSCRAIANSPRNLTDDMLRALARNGGVAMINFEISFLSEEHRVAVDKAGGLGSILEEASKTCGDSEACAMLEVQRATAAAIASGRLPSVTWETIVDHIDHAVRVAGVDHVGLGSDFDGSNPPRGMEDASKLPKLTQALLARGYSDRDVEKILGGNILRVMEQVERAATRR